jgi:RNA polymerase sigma-70 factor (ECF subfamily)
MFTTPPSLLERLRQPDAKEAWARFVQLYTPLLYRWARRLGLQEADAADLVQEVFILLVQHLADFHYQPGKRFRAWLWTIFLNKWRERGRQAAARPPLAADVDPASLPAPDTSEAVGETEYRRYVVGRALRLMQADFEPSTWQACWNYLVEGRPAAEVATALGMTVNAVHLAKSRVLRRLRRELEGLLD